jgi:hypothetical protein
LYPIHEAYQALALHGRHSASPRITRKRKSGGARKIDMEEEDEENEE